MSPKGWCGMELSAFFPGVWDKLNDTQRRALTAAASPRRLAQGELLHGAGAECLGLLALQRGRLRAFMLSEAGREITLYRLFERDICLFSASCMVRSLQFDISIEAERDSELLVISPEVYRRVMEQSAPLANYTNELMASRFSEVMWLVEQVLWKSFDRRLAAFLLEVGAGGRAGARPDARAHRRPPRHGAGGRYADAALFPGRGAREPLPRGAAHRG